MNPQRPDRNGKNSARKGVVLPLTAVLLILLIPVVGLAIDASVLYVLKARLSSAADAAAIAAARSLNVGITLADQEASAQARAQAFFNANFPAGSWATKNQSVTVTVAETSFRTRTVTVNAFFDAPQYFMRMLGFTFTRVRGEGKASRRDVNLMLVLDRSSSMNSGGACAAMKDASTYFVNMFAEGRDRLGLITFGEAYYKGFAPSMNFKTGSSSLPVRISQISCSGNTSTAMGLWQAYQEIVTISEPGALNLLVLFTDGYPNGVTADYPIKDATDDRYGYGDGYRRHITDSSYPPFYKVDTSDLRCNSLNSQCTMEPSPCQDGDGHVYDRNPGDTRRRYNTAGAWNSNWRPNGASPHAKKIRGVLAQWAGDLYNLNTGVTNGLMQWAGTAINSGTVNMADAGCAYSTAYPGNTAGADTNNVRRDIAYMPDQDIYGNSTVEGYKFVATFTAGGHPYYGRMRIDVPMAVTGASFNAADSAASRIRNDTNLKPVIYAIGLESQGGVDEVFLKRVANAADSPIVDETKEKGRFVAAQDTTKLKDAFAQIASEILRISQ